MAKKMRKKKITRKQKDMFTMVAVFFAMWAMIVNPLWLEDQYFNQTAAKGHAMLAGSIITVILLLCVVIAQKSVKPLIPRKNVTEISIMAFGALAVISTLLCDFKGPSFWGNQGWWVGGVQMLLFSVLVIFLSNKLEWSRMLENTIMIIGLIVYFIDLLHGAGVDFMFLHRNMLEGQYWSYLSTFGNINWFMGYIALTLPIILIQFLKSDNNKRNVFYCIYLFMTCIGIIFCRSDGLYVGFGLCAFFAEPFVLSKAQYIRRFLLFVAFYGIAMMITLFMPAYSHMIPIDGVCAIFAHPIVAIGMTIIGIVGYIVVKRVVKDYTASVAKTLTIVFEIGLGLVVAYFVLDLIRNFGDDWGSMRGMIWTYAVNMFKEMPFFNKLIGMGPETLFYYNQVLNERFGGIVLCNHSDVFQFLVTNGVLGLAAWLTMWVSIAVRWVKTRDVEGEEFMFLVAVMAYFGQSLVNSAECLSWPILIVVMGLYLHYYNKKNEVTEEERA
ncbi:MAG: O-antigen ligase family protein [Clostridiales bacterium]|nr:O-antigen ligase family protein [Candidatus Crickella equi]